MSPSKARPQAKKKKNLAPHLLPALQFCVWISKPHTKADAAVRASRKPVSTSWWWNLPAPLGPRNAEHFPGLTAKDRIVPRTCFAEAFGHAIYVIMWLFRSPEMSISPRRWRNVTRKIHECCGAGDRKESERDVNTLKGVERRAASSPVPQ